MLFSGDFEEDGSLLLCDPLGETRDRCRECFSPAQFEFHALSWCEEKVREILLVRGEFGFRYEEVGRHAIREGEV